MKSLIITSIVALGFAAPVMAQSQLEKSVGAPAGEFTLSELAQLKSAAGKSGNDAVVFINGELIDMASGTVTTARR
jgi:hypothetical protein